MILFRVVSRAGKVISRHHLEAVARAKRRALAREHPRSGFRIQERTARGGWRNAGPDPARKNP